MPSKIPFIIVHDESGHNYLIPEHEEPRFLKWVDEMENDGFSNSYDGDKYRIDGTHSLRIFDWEEK
jgi:hypothetical protein